MNGNKKEYESPKLEKMEFNISDTVVASGRQPWQPPVDEDGTPIYDSEHYVYVEGTCTYYNNTNC